MIQVNLLAVLLAAIVSMIVGFIWYNPKLFGKQYMKLADINMKKVSQRETNKTHFLSFLSMLVFAFVLAMIFSFYNGMNALAGIIQGLMIGLGLVATIGIIDYSYARRPGKLYLITYGYYLISIVIMGLIIGAFR